MDKMCQSSTKPDILELEYNPKELFREKLANFIKIQETVFKIDDTEACNKIATFLNVDRSVVSKWKNGTMFPKIENLIKLSIIMNCSLDELLTDTDTNRFTEEDIFSFSKVGITEKQVNQIYDINSVAKWLEDYRITFQRLGVSEELANAIYSQNHKQQSKTLFGPSLPIINYLAPFNYLIENKEFLSSYMQKINTIAEKFLIWCSNNQKDEKFKNTIHHIKNQVFVNKQYDTLKDNVPSDIKKDLEDLEKYLTENFINVVKKHVIDVFNKTIK